MPIDSQTDGPQPLHPPGGETLQAYIPGQLARRL